MALSALGVPRETILEDDHVSTAVHRPEFETPRLNPAADPDNPVARLFSSHQGGKPQPPKSADGTAHLSCALAAIDQRWGSVEAYLE